MLVVSSHPVTIYDAHLLYSHWHTTKLLTLDTFPLHVYAISNDISKRDDTRRIHPECVSLGMLGRSNGYPQVP
jgi:hypothetical protein